MGEGDPEEYSDPEPLVEYAVAAFVTISDGINKKHPYQSVKQPPTKLAIPI